MPRVRKIGAQNIAKAIFRKEKPSTSIRRIRELFAEKIIQGGSSVRQAAIKCDLDYAVVWRFLHGERGLNLESFLKLVKSLFSDEELKE